MYSDPITEAAEEGLPLPEAKVSNDLPPGGGKFVLPHYATFSAIVNSLSRTYRWTHDEALRHSNYNALALRRDPIIMDALRARQIPTAQLAWHLEALDDTDKKEVDAVKGVTEIIQAIPNLQNFFMHLLEALFYGRYGIQMAYAWDFKAKKKRLVVRQFKPINGDKLVFRFSGQAGMLVHSMMLPYGYDTDITDRGRAHFFTPEEREQIIIHKHEPEDADFFEGELAGGVHGKGFRDRLYWWWWLRNQVLEWLMDYLERIGAGGLTVYYYEAGNPVSYAEVSKAAEDQLTNNAILFPRYRDNRTGGSGIDRVEPGAAGAQLIESLVTDYFDNTIRRFILGQSLAQETGSTGLGSGVADLHADTFARRIKYDAVGLQETMNADLIPVLYKYNYPGVRPARFLFDVDKPNAADVLAAAKAFWEMGGEVDSDELRSIIGLAKPSQGGAILTKLPAASPAGVGVVPQGVPMQGQPGPQPGSGGGSPPAQGQGGGQENPFLFSAHDSVRLTFAAQSLVPHAPIAQHAKEYATSAGVPWRDEPIPYEPLNEERSKSIAGHYDKAVHAPNDPAVKGSYDAFKKETLGQFTHLRNKGVQFEPWDQQGQPYKNSQEMVNDVRGNNHLWFYTGGDLDKSNHLSEPTGVVVNGHNLTHNDVFRAVHDYFGHGMYGNQFGPRGEEHAYRVHSRMYSPAARPAMAMETRGQNSWVNFGPYAHLPVTERPYAQQRNNVLPTQYVEDQPVKMSAASAFIRKPEEHELFSPLHGVSETDMPYTLAERSRQVMDHDPAIRYDQAKRIVANQMARKIEGVVLNPKHSLHEVYKNWNYKRSLGVLAGHDWETETHPLSKESLDTHLPARDKDALKTARPMPLLTTPTGKQLLQRRHVHRVRA